MSIYLHDPFFPSPRTPLPLFFYLSFNIYFTGPKVLLLLFVVPLYPTSHIYHSCVVLLGRATTVARSLFSPFHWASSPLLPLTSSPTSPITPIFFPLFSSDHPLKRLGDIFSENKQRERMQFYKKLKKLKKFPHMSKYSIFICVAGQTHPKQ